MRAESALLAGLLLVHSAVSAESFETLTFTPPAGWAASAVQEGRSYTRADRTGIVVFYGSRPEQRAPAEAFAEMWRTQVAPAVPGPTPRPEVHRDGDFSAAAGSMQGMLADGPVSVSLLTITGRGKTLGVVGMARTDAAARELAAFFQTVKLAQPSQAAAPKAAPAAPGVTTPIESAWIRGSYKLDVTGGPGSARFSWDHLFFFKGGLASRSWNPEGFDGFDAAKAAADPKEQRWGHYGTRTESAGGVAIRWANGGELSLARKGANLQSGSEMPYRPLPPVDKLRLDGLYRRGDGKASPTGDDDEIRFTRDGRFEEKGVLRSVMREGPRQGKGTYRIANYTLHLDYDGGARARVGFYTLDKPHAASEAIYLNTFILSRAK